MKNKKIFSIVGIAVIIILVGGAVYATLNQGGYLSPPPPPPGENLTKTDLKYLIIAKFGPVGDNPGIFYCDRDYYPIAMRDETEIAVERFSELQSDTEEFSAILRHLGLEEVSTFSPDQKLRIYREHKQLNAFVFEIEGEKYKFSVNTTDEKSIGLGEGVMIEGFIDSQGTIRITKKESGFITSCPICLAENTLIATPQGEIPVQNLREGMLVWTVNKNGERVSVPLIKISKTPVSRDHHMVHILLDDGREVFASAGHPMANQKNIGELEVGELVFGGLVNSELVNGVEIIKIQTVPYTSGFTYDILPDSETGFYFANGILMGSTLR